MKNQGRRVWAGMLAVVIVLSGCTFSGLSETEKNPPLESGVKPPEVAEENVGEVHYYQVDEAELPDLYREFKLMLNDGEGGMLGWEAPADFTMVGEKIYRPFVVVRPMEEDEREEAELEGNEAGYIIRGSYIQYLEPPYDTCENICLDRNWEEGVKWEEQKLRVTKDGRMLALLKKAGTDVEAVGEVHRDGTCEMLSDTEAEELLQNVGKVVEAETELYEKLLKAGVSAVPVSAYRESGELYYTDGRRLLRYEEDEPVVLLKFSDLDIVMETAHAISVTEDGFCVLGSYKGKYFLLNLTEVAEPVKIEKQEVVLEAYYEAPAMKDAVAMFNRKNKEYRVVFSTGSGDAEQYRQNLQMRISAGEGPDILSPYTFSETEYRNLAENGYLAKLDDLTGDWEKFLPAAKKDGIINGARYGVTVKGSMCFLAGSRELLGDRERWTTGEMMEVVEKSGAQWACFDDNNGTLLNGVEIVRMMCLWDNGNKDYIDWEAGKSHLAEEPFLKLLDFAKRYAGEKNKGLTSYNYGAGLRDGRVALATVFAPMDDVLHMQWYGECFEGKEAFIGFPSREGSGIFFRPDTYYVCAAGKCPEGAKEFLRYLLSDEAQNILTFDEWGSGIPVRKSTLETNLKLLQKDAGTYAGGEEGGIMCWYHLLTDEEVERYLELLERAEPFEFNADGIMGIVREELEPYFAGDRSAEDAARILDNRVQLYLNEMK